MIINQSCPFLECYLAAEQILGFVSYFDIEITCHRHTCVFESLLRKKSFFLINTGCMS